MIATVRRFIRNEPEYPWEFPPRERVARAAAIRWRTYCLLQATSIGIGAVANAVEPDYFGSRKERRVSVKSNLGVLRSYLRMAVGK